MLTQGEELRVIMGVFGHSQLSTTADLYAHLSPSLMRDVAKRMDAWLAASGE
jgi:site-specific recombinase XerD